MKAFLVSSRRLRDGSILVITLYFRPQSTYWYWIVFSKHPPSILDHFNSGIFFFSVIEHKPIPTICRWQSLLVHQASCALSTRLDSGNEPALTSPASLFLRNRAQLTTRATSAVCALCVRVRKCFHVHKPLTHQSVNTSKGPRLGECVWFWVVSTPLDCHTQGAFYMKIQLKSSLATPQRFCYPPLR